MTGPGPDPGGSRAQGPGPAALHRLSPRPSPRPPAASPPTGPGAAGPFAEFAGAVDPDVDLHVPGQREEISGARLLPVLASIAAGGALGALARYAITRSWPSEDFPWAVLMINMVGSALIGVLMVLVAEGGRKAHPLLRPFVGVGLLGGFTTFSAYALDLHELLERGAAGPAAVYAAGTVAGCLAAVWLGAALTRAAVAGRPR